MKAVLIDGAIVATKLEAEESESARPARSAFKLVGVVESVDRDVITGNIVEVVVNGRSIEVQALTRVKGLVELGLRVKVRGIVVGDTLVARKIQGDGEEGGELGASGRDGGDELEFRGVVASITAGATSRTLVLEDGSSFLVLDGTKIKGKLVVGARVRVEAEFTEGLNVATEVKVEGPRGGGGDNGDDPEVGTDGESGATGEEGPGELEFSGIVASVTAGATATTVALEDGTSFLVRDSTDIDGVLTVGASVTVKAVESDGVKVATEVKVEGSQDEGVGTGGDRGEDGGDAAAGASGLDGRGELELSGIVASISAGATSTTVVLEDGSSFLVPEGTATGRELTVGATVTVEAVESDGVRVATVFKVEGSQDEGGAQAVTARETAVTPSQALQASMAEASWSSAA